MFFGEVCEWIGLEVEHAWFCALTSSSALNRRETKHLSRSWITNSCNPYVYPLPCTHVRRLGLQVMTNWLGASCVEAGHGLKKCAYYRGLVVPLGVGGWRPMDVIE